VSEVNGIAPCRFYDEGWDWFLIHIIMSSYLVRRDKDIGGVSIEKNQNVFLDECICSISLAGLFHAD
jgi:hypothetical protein